MAEALTSGAGRVARTPRFWVRRGDFGVVLLASRSPEPVTLAGTGVEVWDAFDAGPRTVDDVVTELADRFGAPTTTVRPDVVALVDELGRAGLLEAR